MSFRSNSLQSSQANKTLSTQKKAFEIDFRSFKLETWYRQIQFPVWSCVRGIWIHHDGDNTEHGRFNWKFAVANNTAIAWSYFIETEQKKTQKRLWKSLRSLELEFPLVRRDKMCSPFVRMKIIKSSKFFFFFLCRYEVKTVFAEQIDLCRFQPRDD